jgi:mutator protein MutT
VRLCLETLLVRIINVAAGLVFRQGTVLITQRHADNHLGGLWEFPGGKCETGESYPDALRRELREELGVEVTVRERFACIDHNYPDRTVHLEFFVCHWRAHEPQPLGCAQFQWVGPDELDHYRFPPADAALLVRLRAARILWCNETPPAASLGSL